jgi:uncharacterized protein YjbI with pentapeptide repeats
MDIRAIRGRKFLLPNQDTQGRRIVTQAPMRDKDVTDAVVQGANWARLQVSGGAITHSSLNTVVMAESRLSTVRLSGCVFTGVDFSSSCWEKARIDQCMFTGCKFAGADLAFLSARDVIFEGCRFGYALIRDFHAAGSVAFLNCSLREAAVETSRLKETIFGGCALGATQFASCDLHGADFRGTDLEAVRGLDSFRGVTITPSQIPELTVALLRDFELRTMDPAED